MRDLGPLIIVYLVERQLVGYTFRRTRAAWPLHVMLVPWFSIADSQRNQLLESLEAFGARWQPFTVHVGKEVLFGPNKNVPVSLVVEQTPVARLHDELLAVAGCYGVQFHDAASSHSGVGQVYRAHITHHDVDGIAHRRYPGDQEFFDSFTVARLLDNDGVQMCEVIQNIALGGGIV